MAVPVNRILLILFGVAVLGSLAFQTLFASHTRDPHRCRALLEKGRWINVKDDVAGPYDKWQPEGCMLSHYTSASIRQCFQGRHIVFSGDAETRQIAYGMARLLQRDEANWDRRHIRPTVPFNLTYHGVGIQQHLTPFLDFSDSNDEVQLVKELRFIAIEDETSPPVSHQKAAALALLGTRKLDDIPNKMQIENLSAVFTRESDLVGSLKDFLTTPMKDDGPGTQVFFAPPLVHPGGGQMGATKQAAMMQEWLHEHESELNIPVAWSFQQMVDGQGKDIWVHSDDSSSSAVSDLIAETQALILLNLRCNAISDRIRHWPYGRTCCTDFGGQPLNQIVILWIGVIWLVLCIGGEIMDLIARRDTPRFRLFNMQVGAFVMACLYCYVADRTQLFPKEMRTMVPYKDAGIFCLPFLIITVLTIRKSKSPPAKPGFPVVEKDQPFLGRDQTEEWKGWMQWCILLWHWCRTEQLDRVEILVFIRLLVAAYLFQTGYNHTTFFLIKKDYSFRRFMAVVLRLNLLDWTLCFLMGSQWWTYYFAPLCTFWFAITWLTMFIGHKRLNDNVQLLLCKMIICVIVVGFIIGKTPFLVWLIGIIRSVFKVHWLANKIQFRVGLDMLVTFWGMFTAVANHSMKEPLQPALRYVLGFTGAVVIGLYWYASATLPLTFDIYKKWQPYIGFIPILAWIAFRNMSSFFRNYSSRAMIFIGRCSLETYILQTHIFLGADFQGVLLIDGLQGNPSSLLLGRWKSVLIIMPLFFWVSSQTATATNKLCAIIMDTSRSSDGPDPAPLPPPTYSDKAEKAVDAGEVGEVNDDIELGDNAPLLERRGSKNILTRAAGYVVGCRIVTKIVDAVFFSLYGRMIIMLLGFWALNLCSPWPVPAQVPDGFTPHRVGP